MALLVIFGIVFLLIIFFSYKAYVNKASLTAYDVMKKEQDIYNKEGFIEYTKENIVMSDKVISQDDSWNDTASKMRKIVSYQRGVLEQIDVDSMDNSWSVNYKTKIYKKYNFEYINAKERDWFLPVKGNPDFDLSPAKKLPIRITLLGLKPVFFIHVNANYYLYYDFFNYSLVRKEYYTGEGEKRNLESAQNFETKMIPKTNTNIEKLFIAPPIPNGFKVCEATFKNLKGQHYAFIDDDCFAATSNEEVVAHRVKVN